jgi:hypothetical protein
VHRLLGETVETPWKLLSFPTFTDEKYQTYNDTDPKDYDHYWNEVYLMRNTLEEFTLTHFHGKDSYGCFKEFLNLKKLVIEYQVVRCLTDFNELLLNFPHVVDVSVSLFNGDEESSNPISNDDIITPPARLN